ncbi:MAG: type II toxin-antitoxin system prevent-host-death family antitoxin [Nitrospirae bacterium]|nr:type II toxin-antitoxin system prevent-host-death family antitoxin [Nitrospirota bacterium]
MEHAGIRELKNKLSSYISKVREGESLIVTDHGIEVAVISPVSLERRCMISLVKDGQAQWSGGRPKGCEGIKVKGKSLSGTILEERQ